MSAYAKTYFHFKYVSKKFDVKVNIGKPMLQLTSEILLRYHRRTCFLKCHQLTKKQSNVLILSFPNALSNKAVL